MIFFLFRVSTNKPWSGVYNKFNLYEHISLKKSSGFKKNNNEKKNRKNSLQNKIKYNSHPQLKEEKKNQPNPLPIVLSWHGMVYGMLYYYQCFI